MRRASGLGVGTRAGLGIWSAVVFAILLVTATTMAMVSSRTHSRSGRVEGARILHDGCFLLSLFVSESVALALLRGLLGALAGAGMVRFIADAPQMSGLFNGLRVNLGHAWRLLAMAALVGFVSGVVPSYTAASTEIVKGLRHIG